MAIRNQTRFFRRRCSSITCTSTRRRPSNSGYGVLVGDARFLGIFVEGINQRLVVLVDGATLHLLRRRQLAALDREVVLEQSDLFRNLEVRRALQLLVHFLLHLRLDGWHT